ncbi:flagellar basal-body rod protein FlgG [Streptohalobacillus salinus]|uniref:Flagellar basal-body rod protein FlgG n=1 Tax=Streptohalobacillus salinus TaxID=621096 RepID=A0A2V3WFJ0_9BACI|nr:flagellar hook-basal body protein [Streptohalobacillus salinus]PXW92036.1 flagellar basal-body rod protein FlgG [Streptohalobacillus salinus]
MSRMSFQAATTMRELQTKMDLIGHNVSNTNTTGYKSQMANFNSLLYQNIDNFGDVEANAEGRVSPHGIRQGAGARLGHTNIDLSQGTVTTTDRALDVALLEDNQLLEVEVTENGNTETRYTRDGSLYLQPTDTGEVALVTRNGHAVLNPAGAPITLAEDFDDVNIDDQGQLVVTRGAATLVEGQLSVSEAIRPQFLEATGNNLFRLPDLTEVAFNAADIIDQVAVNDITLAAGRLEASNVNLSTQMTDLIQSQRAYQFNARSISMHDQMRGLINQMR